MSRSLLEVYDAFIAKEVHRFLKRYNIGYENFDDYLQQARLGVLEYIQKHDMNPDEMTALDHYKLKTHIFHCLFIYMCGDYLISGGSSKNYRRFPSEFKSVIYMSDADSIEDKATKQRLDDVEVTAFRFKNPLIMNLYFEGYNYKDISEMLKQPSSTVRSQIRSNIKDYFA